VTGVRDGEVRVALSLTEVEHLPLLTRPEAVVDGETVQDAVTAFENAALKWPQKW